MKTLILGVGIMIGGIIGFIGSLFLDTIRSHSYDVLIYLFMFFGIFGAVLAFRSCFIREKEQK